MEHNSKIYVAGHRGLLGSAVCRQLEAKGYSNLVFQNSQSLDLRSRESVFGFFEKERPEYVFLCAAKVGGIWANQESPVDFFVDNMRIQLNLFEAAQKYAVQKLLFVGSSCIYPKEAPIPIQEESLLTGPLEQSNEAYALAKISGVRLCAYYRKQYGSNFISAIPTNLYGINDNYDPENSHVFPALIRKVHEAKVGGETSITLWGSGQPMREFMLSDDCADALVFLMERYNGESTVNVGTGKDMSILDTARSIAKALNVDLDFEFDASKPDGTFRKVTDVSKLKALGWLSKYNIEEGIQIAYADFLKRVEK